MNQVCMRLRLFVLMFLIAPVFAEDFTGRCVGVTDGDTISVMHNDKAEIIRLDGIDAPESGQDYYSESKRVLNDLVMGKDVRVVTRAKDRLNRSIGNVVLASNNWNVNGTLVRNGYAWHYPKLSPARNFSVHEQLAKKEKKGFWSKSSPIAPWIYRSYMLTKDILSTSTASRTQADIKPKTMVCISRSGKRYHRLGCRYLTLSKEMSLGEAQDQGYYPCSICKPIGYQFEQKTTGGYKISEEERQERLAQLQVAQQQYEAYIARQAAQSSQAVQMTRMQRRVPVNVGISGGSDYISTGGGHWIEEVVDTGEIIKLEDGSLWKISPFDHYKTTSWVYLDEITVIEGDDYEYTYKLINTDEYSDSVVEARYLGE